MNINRALNQGLKLLESASAIAPGQGPQTFTWHSKEVPCVPTSFAREIQIDSKGNPVVIVLKLIVRREHFVTFDSTLITMDSEAYTMDNETPTPVAGRNLIFRGEPYRIATARESGPKSHLELTLVDPHSNR